MAPLSCWVDLVCISASGDEVIGRRDKEALVGEINPDGAEKLVTYRLAGSRVQEPSGGYDQWMDPCASPAWHSFTQRTGSSTVRFRERCFDGQNSAKLPGSDLNQGIGSTSGLLD